MSSQASSPRKETTKVEQGVLDMSSSLPSSSSGRFSSANKDFSTEIRVAISPDPSQSHAHTPFKDTSTDASRQDENTGVDEKTPPVDVPRISKEDLYLLAIKGEWQDAISICDKHPGMVRTPLTVSRDTILHIAVSRNNVDFGQGLVNIEHMTGKDLEIRDSAGNTAFCVAAISGNARDATLLEIMMDKNGNLPLVSGQDGML